MRIAVIADIHGNLHAFEAALKDIRSRGVDSIVVAGDIVVGAPDSVACWDLATSLGVPIIRGNHERYVFDFGTERALPEWSDRRFLPVAWAVERAGDERRAAMAALPMTYSPPGFERELIICHASTRGDHDTVTAHTSDAQLAEYFPGDPPPLIVRGHNHNVRETRWRGPWGERTIVTIGSNGLPLEGFTVAQYAILNRDTSAKWSVEHHWLDYDLRAALRRFEETNYLAEIGPMGELFYRELATASYQILPFLRWMKRWSSERAITLDEAMARFLGRF